MSHWLAHWLGLDNPAGRIYLSWSGFIGTSVFGAVGAMLRRLMKRHHREQLAQAARHHHERIELDAQHHKEHLELLRKHHSQVLDAQRAPEIVVTPAAVAPRKRGERI